MSKITKRELLKEINDCYINFNVDSEKYIDYLLDKIVDLYNEIDDIKTFMNI